MDETGTQMEVLTDLEKREVVLTLNGVTVRLTVREASRLAQALNRAWGSLSDGPG